jgi:MoxR-like ATPase
MTPKALTQFLTSLVKQQLKYSVMIWGPPGVGKSSIVAQIAQAQQLEWTDVRLSQLAPTDLRGLPVADHDHHVSRWYPPEFLPRKGKGILFLDELNMAPPAMQGMAQQLILDRKVGSYTVPEGWFIWAAGNRKEDRASVFDMPTPLANRFLHLAVEPDLESFKAYALAAGAHEQILAFLSFRPNLLHKLDANQPAWPSPRSWMMASALHTAKLSIEPVVGTAAEGEFRAYLTVYKNLPDIEKILQGAGDEVLFPKEPSARYATVMALTRRTTDDRQSLHAFRWIASKGTSEWAQMFARDLFTLLNSQNKRGVYFKAAAQEPRLRKIVVDYDELLREETTREDSPPDGTK